MIPRATSDVDDSAFGYCARSIILPCVFTIKREITAVLPRTGRYLLFTRTHACLRHTSIDDLHRKLPPSEVASAQAGNHAGGGIALGRLRAAIANWCEKVP